MMVTSLALVILLVIVPQTVLSQEERDFGCVKYPATPYSSFNTWNVFVVYPRRHPDMLITKVEVIRRDFYRCQMTQKGVEIFFYGTNGTHYWVEKGCAGDFMITECPKNQPDLAGVFGREDSLTVSIPSTGGSGGFEGISATSLLKSIGNVFDNLKNQWQNIS